MERTVGDNAKRGTAPCGHPGLHVTARYVTCSYGCDSSAVPEHIDPERTPLMIRFCPHCRSENIVEESNPFAGFFGATPSGWRCLNCGVTV